MRYYDLVKFLHVLGAAVWVGSGVALLTLFTLVRRAGDEATMAGMTRQSIKLGNIVFGPAAAATFVFGILLVFISDAIGFTDLWVLIGFGGVLFSGVISGGMGGTLEKRAAALEAEPGADRAAIDALRRRVVALNRIDLVILIVVVWAMVDKPTL